MKSRKGQAERMGVSQRAGRGLDARRAFFVACLSSRRRGRLVRRMDSASLSDRAGQHDIGDIATRYPILDRRDEIRIGTKTSVSPPRVALNPHSDVQPVSHGREGAAREHQTR